MEKILIVGSGVAGITLHHCMSQYVENVYLMDDFEVPSSTMVAAGMINPITGRKFNLTWKYEELMPVFKEVYGQISATIGLDILSSMTLIREIDTIENENQIFSLGTPFIHSDHNTNPQIEEWFNAGISRVAIEAFRLHTSEMVEKYSRLLKSKGLFLNEKFDFAKLSMIESKLKYKDQNFDRIIFCEGYAVVNNPFFRMLPFQPVKGEVIIAKIPNLTLDVAYKNKLFFIPISPEIFWIGSGYEWSFNDSFPSEKGILELVNKIKSVLKSDFEILETRAAIRPSTKHRKPIIGWHPQYKSIGVVNGLGTKGSMLAPYLAKMMTQSIFGIQEIEAELNVGRFIQ